MATPLAAAAVIVAAPVVATVALLVVRRLYTQPSAALTWFCWLLPLHVVLIAFLFGVLRLPGATVRAVAAWKEMVVLAVVFAVALRAVAGRATSSRACWTDYAVGACVAWAGLFLLTETALLGARLPLLPQLYGARDSAFFMLLYFVGRATPEIEDGRLLRTVATVGALAALAGVLERLFVPPELLVLLGAALYYQDFLGAAAVTLGNDFGLPDNYWSEFGHTMVRRVGSVYMSSQSFAVACLLVVPAVTILAMRSGPRRRRAWAAFALVWVALLLTITRMTIVTCVVQLLVLALLLRRPQLVAGTVAVAVAGFGVAMAAVPRLPTFVWQTITWQSGSSVSHAESVRVAVEAVATRPLGSGLGSGDLALRFGGKPLSGDNMYLKYAVEQGVPGLLLQVLALAAIARAGLALWRTGRTSERRELGAFVLVAAIGIALNAAMTMPYGTNALAYVFFWAAGSAVTLAQQESFGTVPAAAPRPVAAVA